MRQAGEPSVEEILESIKQVIARDNRRPPDGGPADASVDGTHRPGQLSSGEARDAGELAPEGAAGDVLDLAEAEIAAPPGDVTSGLLSEGASRAVGESLHTLASLARPAAGTTAPSGRDNGIEALVRELLRPQLAAWLDGNLPRIIEEMVAAEIARIVGRR